MTRRAMPSEGLLSAVRAAVGAEHCLTDPALMASYERDWTGRFGGDALLVARPSSVAGVAAVLSTCARHEVAVVPQGGNTGLVGGSVPRGGEVVLSTSGLDRVLRIDPEESVLEAEAGVSLATAQQAAAAVGAELGIDLAARDTATLGGMVATNAGGIHVVRYGTMRARLAGIEAVLVDGTVVSRRSGLVKDNVGYDLAGLLAGSEGTLAVITKVLLRLVPRARWRVTALVALEHPGTRSGTGQETGNVQEAGRSRLPFEVYEQVTTAAMTVAARLLRGVDGIEALELVYADGMALVREHAGLQPPPGPDAAAWLLVEAAGNQDPTPALAEVLESAPGAGASAVAADGPGRARLWAYRERHTEAIASVGVAHKLDVALPRAALPGFAAAVRAEVAMVDPRATVICFGHLGDGNLHVNVLGPEPGDDRVDEAVLRLVLAHGGSISAEHGVGIAKRALVADARSPGDLAVMRRVKAALDPAGILNPGVLLPPVDAGGPS